MCDRDASMLEQVANHGLLTAETESMQYFTVMEKQVSYAQLS